MGKTALIIMLDEFLIGGLGIGYRKEIMHLCRTKRSVGLYIFSKAQCTTHIGLYELNA